MVRAMHIFTGAKGGTGKTLMCLASIAAFLQQGKQVVVVDLNYHNADLSEILRIVISTTESGRHPNGTPFKVPRDVGDTGFEVFPFKLNTANHYLVAPKSLGKYYGFVPNGIKSVYDVLDQIVYHITSTYEQNQAINDFIFVVDTPFHLCNLKPHDNSLFSLNGKRDLVALEPYFWFNWNIATAVRTQELNRTQEALIWLSRHWDDNETNSTRQWLRTESKNLIHVINPFVLALSGGRWFASLGRAGVPIYPFVTYNDLTMSRDGMSFSVFAACIKKTVEILPGSRSATQARFDYNDIYDRLVDNIRFPNDTDRPNTISRRYRSGGSKPKNVLLVPRFFRNVTGYTDQVEWSRNQQNSPTFADLYVELREIIDAVDGFMRLAELA